MPVETVLFRSRDRTWTTGAARPSATVTVLVEFDAFKCVHDRAAHRAGDQVLRRIAEVLRATLGRSDFVARFATWRRWHPPDVPPGRPDRGVEVVSRYASKLRARRSQHRGQRPAMRVRDARTRGGVVRVAAGPVARSVRHRAHGFRFDPLQYCPTWSWSRYVSSRSMVKMRMLRRLSVRKALVRGRCGTATTTKPVVTVAKTAALPCRGGTWDHRRPVRIRIPSNAARVGMRTSIRMIGPALPRYGAKAGPGARSSRRRRTALLHLLRPMRMPPQYGRGGFPASGCGPSMTTPTATRTRCRPPRATGTRPCG